MESDSKRMRPHNVCMGDEMWFRVETTAADRGVSAGQIVREALDAYLRAEDTDSSDTEE